MRYFWAIRDVEIKQLFYLILNRLGVNLHYLAPNFKSRIIKPIKFKFLRPSPELIPENYTLKFLNKEKTFHSNLDWSFMEYGKLWNYNMNYFSYITQRNLEPSFKIKLLNEFQIFQKENRLFTNDPYPTALRIINLIKCACDNSNDELHSIITDITKNDLENLLKKLEYHLGGNHLLENGFSLWFASFVFDNDKLKETSINLLTKELDRQILDDGAHIELSPMYHTIILGRLLECISIGESNESDWNKNAIKIFRQKAEVMLGWLSRITFNFRYFIRINDSVEGIAPSLESILDLCYNLNIKPRINTDTSGFETRSFENFDILIDLSNILSKNQPGHSHADSLNYLLWFNRKPIIVDPGISTYEESISRVKERSTKYHNTVSLGDKNSSEIWGSFRVGRKAITTVLEKTQHSIEAMHDGYKKYNINITRKWIIDNNITIIDTARSQKKLLSPLISNIHFHPNICLEELDETTILIDKKIKLKFKGDLMSLKISEYNYSKGFNDILKAKKIEVMFLNALETIISKDS